jgi:glycosyltransferase involved in cell wall biosynthesis
MSTTLRVAIVSDFYLDYVGGLQSSLLEQKAALEDAGHTVLLVSLARDPLGEVPGVGLQIRPAYTVPGVILPVITARPRLVARLRDYLERERIDVVHTQTEFGLAHAAATAATQLAIPVVHTVHTFYWQSVGIGPTLATPIMRFGLEDAIQRPIPRVRFGDRAADNLLRNLTLAMAMRADTVVSPSAHQADDLIAAGVGRPVVVIPNPITRSRSAPRQLTREQAAYPRIVWVARCEPEKRPLVFAEAVLEALERTRREPGGAHGGGFGVDFVGDGSELTALRRLAEGHPEIRVHGGLDHDAVIDLMDAACLVALTSDGFDNQPMTIAEASSRYRGVLYCDPKLREGLTHSGHLAASPDASALADAIVELTSSPDRLLELSDGARLDSSTFSAAAYVDGIASVYTGASARA